MTSQKPYLISAIYEWCEDNGFTPYLSVMVDKNTMVPMQYVENNQIVLDLSDTAAKNLIIDKQWITFKASFGGTPNDIAVPTCNVTAIFARENGQGMQFQVEPFIDDTPRKSGGLRLVK
ncbi:MAG: ClpXP protease specificity-enhancing factor [Burkholderiales bacterium]|jgi:stringent starvation protein B|nr:ClpXP protease specificity-enhancing factor [Burkholderiales bacterium]